MWMHKSVVIRATFVCVVCISIYSFHSFFYFFYSQRSSAHFAKTNMYAQNNNKDKQREGVSGEEKKRATNIKCNEIPLLSDLTATLLYLLRGMILSSQRFYFVRCRYILVIISVDSASSARSSFCRYLFSLSLGFHFCNKSFSLCVRAPKRWPRLQCCLFSMAERFKFHRTNLLKLTLRYVQTQGRETEKKEEKTQDVKKFISEQADAHAVAWGRWMCQQKSIERIQSTMCARKKVTTTTMVVVMGDRRWHTFKFNTENTEFRTKCIDWCGEGRRRAYSITHVRHRIIYFFFFASFVRSVASFFHARSVRLVLLACKCVCTWARRLILVSISEYALPFQVFR